MCRVKGIQVLIRLLAIDRRLRKLPHPTIEDLIECVQDALDGQEVSERTVKLDLENMRYHNGLRLFAPIVYKRGPGSGRGKGGYYKYSDREYSITKMLEANQMPTLKVA